MPRALANYGTIPTLPILKKKSTLAVYFSLEDLVATVGFHGLTVAAFESRMALEIARLIERHGESHLSLLPSVKFHWMIIPRR